MCAFDNLSVPSAKPFVVEYEIRVTKHEEHLTSSSHLSDDSDSNSSSETLCSLPAYESLPRTTIPSMPQPKRNFLHRVFKGKSNKTSNASQLPSYRETELAEAWAKIGIDVNDRSQGPKPKCTPEELLRAMDGLFGEPTLPKGAAGKRRDQDGVVVHSFPGSRGF
ncbi:uncharacterized protein MEPE_02939 [Melanopsichium pennsylvanicum]|uniref:Uncharacterized protein n=2 Tax=Melanopsichium pennsylvanicum TaxID=63383 RepID=A0AAJ4XLN2_9BASI|nr:putative protein [Melanopsichium pennsylvanicum 4]SNX84231.1 uncharacterized protein MEPE_02939 [Melanopsichium pennsylvanicum]